MSFLKKTEPFEFVPERRSTLITIRIKLMEEKKGRDDIIFFFFYLSLFLE